MSMSTEEIANMLDSTGWSHDFSYQQLLMLSEYLQVYSIPANTEIYHEGDVGDSMGVLIQGIAKVCKDDKILTELRPGRTFGEMSLLDHQRRSASVITVTPSVFLSLDKTNFDKLSKERPALALKIIVKVSCLLSQHVRRMSGQLCEFLDE